MAAKKKAKSASKSISAAAKKKRPAGGKSTGRGGGKMLKAKPKKAGTQAPTKAVSKKTKSVAKPKAPAKPKAAKPKVAKPKAAKSRAAAKAVTLEPVAQTAHLDGARSLAGGALKAGPARTPSTLSPLAGISVGMKRKNRARSTAVTEEQITSMTAAEMGPDAAPAAPVKRRRRTGISRTSHRMEKLTQKWSTLQTRTKGIKPETYSMRKSFEARTPIVHKTLGWGYILNNINDRLEVLFQDGIRYLISNYKA